MSVLSANVTAQHMLRESVDAPEPELSSSLPFYLYRLKVKDSVTTISIRDYSNLERKTMPGGKLGRCFLCHEETPRQCENCDLFICSDYCQSKHRYHDTCLPFKVENSPEIGRYVVATRDILPTELIISEEAAALGPCPNTLPRCLTCLASLGADTAVSCDKCNFPFCSKACSQTEVHVNNECAVFPYR